MWAVKALLLLGAVLASKDVKLTTSLKVSGHTSMVKQVEQCSTNPVLTIESTTFIPSTIPTSSVTETIIIYLQNTSGVNTIVSSMNFMLMETETSGIQTGTMQFNNQVTLTPNQIDQVELNLNLDLNWPAGTYVYGVEVYDQTGTITACGAGSVQIGVQSGFLAWIQDE